MDIIRNFLKNTTLVIYTMLLIPLLLLLLFGILKGFSIWFLVIGILWVCIFYIFKFTQFTKLFTQSIWLVIYIVFLFLTVFFVIRVESNVESNSTFKKLSVDECKPYVEKYNGKVLSITGENLIGTVGINIDPQTCKLSGRYIVTFTADLAKNPDNEIPGGYQYNYIVLTRESLDQSRENRGHGVLSIVRKNAQTLPDPFSDSIAISEYYSDNSVSYDTSTNNFYWTYQIERDFSQERYDLIFKEVYFEVVDGLPFIEKRDEGDGVTSSAINHDRTEVEGEIVKTIKLTISE